MRELISFDALLLISVCWMCLGICAFISDRFTKIQIEQEILIRRDALRSEPVFIINNYRKDPRIKDLAVLYPITKREVGEHLKFTGAKFCYSGADRTFWIYAMPGERFDEAYFEALSDMCGHKIQLSGVIPKWAFRLKSENDHQHTQHASSMF